MLSKPVNWENRYFSFSTKLPQNLLVFSILMGCATFGYMLDFVCSEFPLRNTGLNFEIFGDAARSSSLALLLSKTSISAIIMFVTCVWLFIFFNHKYVHYVSFLPSKDFDAIAYMFLVFLSCCILSYAISPQRFFYNLFCVIIIFIPSIIYCWINYARYIGSQSVMKDRVRKSNFPKSFENRVFFPTLIYIGSSIQFGVFLFSSQKHDYGFFLENKMSSSIEAMLVFLSAIQSLAIIYFINSIKILSFIHLIIPLCVVVFGVVAFIAFGWLEGKYIFAIYCLTYSLGLCEAIVHLTAIHKRKGTYHKRAERIYIPGSNWAIVWITVTTLFLPVVVEEIGYRFLVIYHVSALIIWLNVPEYFKLGRFGRLFGVLAAFNCVCAYIVSCTDFGSFGLFAYISSKLNGQAPVVFWYTTVLAMFSITSLSVTLVRFAKDIVGLKLESFFLLIRERFIYRTLVGPMIFTLICSAAFCVVCLVFWFLSSFQKGISAGTIDVVMYRLAVSSILSVFTATLVFSMTFFVSGKLKASIDDAIRLNIALDNYVKEVRDNDEKRRAALL